MNHYILEFVNKCTGHEGVIAVGLTKQEARDAYMECHNKWWATEVWYGPHDELMTKPAMVNI